MNVDLTVPWDLADIVFIIEDKKLYVNKPILMMSSDVFRTMFTADFREKELAEIPLPGKNFDTFLQLMKVIHPPHMEVNGTNVHQLLPLSHEYGVHHVTSSCERFLLTEPPSVQNLVLADRYSLLQLHEACVQYAQQTTLTQLEAKPGFDELQAETKVEVLHHKVLHMELEQEQKKAEQKPEDVELEEQEAELTKEFLCELMSKPPSVQNLVLAEKYVIPQLKKKCIQYAKNKPLSELKAEPGYDKITPATLVQILNSKVVAMEPRVGKLERLERELKSAESILTQVTSLGNGQKQSQTLCTKLPEQNYGAHTAGSIYKLTYPTPCTSCERLVLRDMKNLCVPALQKLSSIK